jgi:hypothetical protein
MVDISIVNGIINQLITWGAPHCSAGFMMVKSCGSLVQKHEVSWGETVPNSPWVFFL